MQQQPYAPPPGPWPGPPPRPGGAAATPPPASGTARRTRRRVVLALYLLAQPLLFLTAQTLLRYDGEPFDRARAVHTAEVTGCTRHGPVTVAGGFGTWYECFVRVPTGTRPWEQATIGRPGYFARDETGRSITIGYNGKRYNDNGTVVGEKWSRPDLPDRWYVAFAGRALWAVPVLTACMLLLLAVAWVAQRVRGRRAGAR